MANLLSNPGFEAGAQAWQGNGFVATAQRVHGGGQAIYLHDMGANIYQQKSRVGWGFDPTPMPLSFTAWVWANKPNAAYVRSSFGRTPYHPGDSQWHQMTIVGDDSDPFPWVGIAVDVPADVYFDDANFDKGGVVSPLPIPELPKFNVDGIITWAKANPMLAAGIGVGAYLLLGGNRRRLF